MNEEFFTWLNDELNKIKLHVLRNPEFYPPFHDGKVVLDINLWINNTTDQYMCELKCPGFCLKDKDKVEYWKCETKNDVKLYDIFISPTMVCNSINTIEKTTKFQFPFEDALLSILVHEFTHAISKGFEEFIKDEFYTDFYAKEILKQLHYDIKFYTPYPYSVYCKDYNQIGEKEDPAQISARNLYFKGEKL